MTLSFFLISSLDSLAEVYLTKEQALNVVLGEDTEKEYLPQELSLDLINELKEKSLLTDQMSTAHFFIGRKNKEIIGYALIDQELGKHLPITYIVGLSPAGEVTRVEMMVFREVRGWEARERRFLAQFEGKKIGDSLSVGENLKNVTGATISAKSMAKGTKRALYLWNYYFNPIPNKKNGVVPSEARDLINLEQ